MFALFSPPLLRSAMPHLRNLVCKIKTLPKVFLTDFCQRRFLALAPDITPSLPDGPLLVVAPHPDDETLGCAGIMAHYKALGRAVRIVVVTDGSAAVLPESTKPQEVAALRRKESLQAAALLGIAHEDVVFLGHPDGGASQRIDRIAQDVASQIWLFNPALILAPAMMDAHPDHRAVAAAINKLQVEGKIACRRLDYPMWFWVRPALKHLFSPARLRTHRKVAISPYLDLKQRAIDAHACPKHEQNWKVLEAYHIAADLRPFELFFEPATE